MYHEIKLTTYSSFNKHPEYFTAWKSFLEKYNDIQLHGGYHLSEQCVELFTFYDKNEKKIINYVEDQNKERTLYEYQHIIQEFIQFRINFYKVTPPNPETRSTKIIIFNLTPEYQENLEKIAEAGIISWNPEKNKYSFQNAGYAEALMRFWNVGASAGSEQTVKASQRKIIEEIFLFRGGEWTANALKDARKDFKEDYLTQIKKICNNN